METLRTDLSQDFLHVTRTIEHLGQRLTDVAEQVRTFGVLPSEDLIDAITMTRRSFEELRGKAIELVGLLGQSSAKTPEDIGSVKDLEALLQAVTEAQRKRAQGEKVRLRALTILDHILSLIHREQPEFPPLGEVQAEAKALRETLRASEDPDVHPEATALAQGRHPLAEFLTLVEGHNQLDDDLWLLLQHAVAEHFGKPLAMSAARGKLCQSPARLIPDRSTGEQRHNSLAADTPDTCAGGTASPSPAP
ncbi:MAG: hypothetical protein NW202_06310 [Nitrospira sp.]|nr:hypothetical protein [Nitrospira sp.]